MEKIKKNKLIVLLLVILMGVFWTFLIPKVKVASDFPFASSDFIRSGFNIPSAWQVRSAEGMGEYGVMTLWAWPVDFLYGMGAKLGFTFGILERISGFVLVLGIGVAAEYLFLRHFKVGKWGRFVGTLFYLVNTYIFLIIDGGQLAIALAFAWFPLAYVVVEKAIPRNKLKDLILVGAVVSVLGFLDIRFVYILGILLGLRFLYEFVFLERRKWLSWILSWAKLGIIALIILVSLNAYWLLPGLLLRFPSLPFIVQTPINFATLGHGLLVLQPHWYKNIFGQITDLRAEFIFIPILAFIAPIVRKKNRFIGFWILVSLLSVFLVKGNLPPFPEIYNWLFNHLPGFSLFRDSTKFYFLICLSYSFLIGTTIDVLSKKVRIVVPLLIAYFLLLSYPVYTLQMTGILSRGGMKVEYQKMSRFLMEDQSFGRVLWLPSYLSMGYGDTNHQVLEGLRLITKRPFSTGVIGSYEFLNFLRDSSFIGQILNITGVKYVAYPFPDVDKGELNQDQKNYYYSFYKQIARKDWVGKIIDFGEGSSPLPLYLTRAHQDRFFAISNTWLVVGSEEIYEKLDRNKVDLTKNGLIFLDQKKGLEALIESLPYSKILIYSKSKLDLAASFIHGEDLVFPSNKLDFSPNQTGWWKRYTNDLISWRTFLQDKYGLDDRDFDLGGGYAIAEGEKTLNVSSASFLGGRKLLVRLLKSSRSGKVDFYQKDDLIGSIETKVDIPKVFLSLEGGDNGKDKILEYGGTNFLWVEVGGLKKDGEITIKTSGDINIINAIAVLKETSLIDLQNKANSLMDSGRVLVWNGKNLKDFSSVLNPIISYQRISPVFYKVKVKGVDRRFTLAFSDTYDSLWRIGDQSSFPLYTSLINGFTVTKDGEYSIFYLPQKYVNIGFIISIISSVSILIFLIKSRKSSII